ncbi:LuxR C-terminal-related transcriptional regulator [Streptomyces cyaneofuscatus]|uniref:helix-turn-helix transcriptional regulator n=1 Tax=unclassified Streptomyces TaxID=2593676 RepID=UPI000978F6D9|nr:MULTISPECIES: LuxR family transcriptional regulator [unclassified Streptomyces]ONI52238.1 Bacterial regulatory protein, luxR family [Streptomyces sp. IB2014 011-1]RDV50579.1 helix-turn-helix transcriptional regulator [Streptomyces sp. IB2014 011-12]
MCTTTENTDGRGSVHGLCEPALRLYATALREGRLPRTDLAGAPCLVQRGLVRPDPDDERWVRPVPASAALTRLLRPLAQEVFERLDATAALVDALLPLASIAGHVPVPHPEITVVSGKPAIQESLEEAGRRTREHILTLHPGSKRPAELLERARKNALPPLQRGVSVRHIYQHSARYSPPLNHYVDRLPYEGLQIRTMEQTPERLFIFDRVAYIPTTSQRDVALRITHPALVRYLIHVYDVLWAQATPFGEPLPTALPDTPLTAVQQSIARLLTEGHVDEVVARKMGISVRTCRSHIAKLMQTLGATSRTHLGALLVQSGIAGAGRGGT